MKNIDIKESYNKDLIKIGSKSNKFKKLPKDVELLSMAEFYFLADYVAQGFNKLTLK